MNLEKLYNIQTKIALIGITVITIAVGCILAVIYTINNTSSWSHWFTVSL